jgi:hypothetical protein
MGGGDGGGGGGGDGGHGTHDVAVPSALQVSGPGPARARSAHRELCRVSDGPCMWCGCVCGADDTRGVGRGLAWRLGHGARGVLTSDVLAALYWPYGQAEQPEVQPESQE